MNAMIYRIINIQPRIDNCRIATIVEYHSTQGKEIECCISETGDGLAIITTKYTGPLIPSMRIEEDVKLDDLRDGDTLTVED